MFKKRDILLVVSILFVMTGVCACGPAQKQDTASHTEKTSSDAQSQTQADQNTSTSSQNSLGDKKVLKVVGASAPPYRIFEGTNTSGIYFDAIKEIAKRIDLNVQISEVPNERAFFMMQDGSADIMLGPNKTPEREAFMIFTDAAFPPADKAFYTYEGGPDISKYEDLDGKKICISRGKVYFTQFDNDKSLNKEEVGDYNQAILMVNAKRSDLVIMPEQEGDYLLKNSSVKLKKCSYIIEGALSYITISKKSQFIGIKQQLEDTMNQIKSDGTMEKILNKYR